MRFTAILSSVLALGALTTAAPVALDTSVTPANIVARTPEAVPGWGVVGKVLTKVFRKPGTKASNKVAPAPSQLQEELGLGPDGRWIG